jgi:hypothetical protein
MSAPLPDESKPKQENALANLMLNVLLPVTILSYCSKETGWYSLGPVKALIISVLLPVVYFIYDWLQRRKVNAFSIIGMVSVLITGGLGLMDLGAHAFALKEAAIPLILGAVLICSHRAGKPLAKTMLLNPEMVDVAKIDSALNARQQQAGFDKLLWETTLTLAGSFVLSAMLNYGLALYFLTGKQPRTEEYTAGIGKLTGWGFLVIGVPMIACLLFAFTRLIKGLRALTGLSQDEIMLPR